MKLAALWLVYHGGVFLLSPIVVRFKLFARAKLEYKDDVSLYIDAFTSLCITGKLREKRFAGALVAAPRG